MAAKKRSYRMTTRAAGKEQTRERILQAAYDLFLAGPFEDLTLKGVAEKAGVSLQTVIVHFGTKEGLVRAVPAWRAPREAASREVEPGDVAGAAAVLVARYEELGTPTIRMLALEERYEALAPAIAAGRASHREWVERIFADAIRAAGDRRARLRRTMALVAATDVYVWHVLRRVLDPNETTKAIAELIAAIVTQRKK